MQVEEGRGLVLKQNGAKMGIAAVGRGEILSILGVVRGSVVFQRRSGRGVLLSRAVKGGLKSRISRVPLLLSDGGFALGVSRTSSGGVASGLSHAGALLLGESSRSGLLGHVGARLRGLEGSDSSGLLGHADARLRGLEGSGSGGVGLRGRVGTLLLGLGSSGVGIDDSSSGGSGGGGVAPAMAGRRRPFEGTPSVSKRVS